MQTVSKRGFTYYDEAAQEFHRAVSGRKPIADAQWIAQTLSQGSRVIDAGCGTGEDTAYLASCGLQVYAYDASSAMCALTREKIAPLGSDMRVEVQCHDHLGLNLVSPVSAILASASLLFLQEDDLIAALAHLGAQLHHGGVLLASFKRGQTARSQDDGRVYFDREPSQLLQMAAWSGLEPVEARTQNDVLGRAQGWVTFVLRRNCGPTAH